MDEEKRQLFRSLGFRITSYNVCYTKLLRAGQNDVDQNVVGAEATATGLLDIATLADFGLDALLGELGFESVDDLLGPGGKAPGTGTDQYFNVFRGFGHMVLCPYSG